MTAEALLADHYAITMLRGYFAHGMYEEAVFEAYVRRLPSERGFLVAAGLEPVVDFLERLRFAEDELRYMARHDKLDPSFLGFLRQLRFTGDVDAIPEGTVVFENEPLLRVTAPLPEAQLVETRLLNLLHFQTVVASKAARAVLVAQGKLLIDFGARRAHGLEAGLLGARASYLAGFDGTSIMLAGRRFGVPVYGTIAHSFIEAHDDEMEAFRHFVRANPDNPTLLLDTYDTEDAARGIVQLAREGLVVRGVRLDSGDLIDHACNVRRILDGGGLRDCKIYVSGGLDEERILALVRSGAPIDGFGVGTRLDTSADAPFLDCAYKLEEYAGRPRRKRSEGKASWPGRKQVYRRRANGHMTGDTVTLVDDVCDGEPLLVPVMRGGRRVAPQEGLGVIRRRAAEQLRLLPAHLQALDVGPAYAVEIAPPLVRLAEQLDERTSPASR